MLKNAFVILKAF